MERNARAIRSRSVNSGIAKALTEAAAVPTSINHALDDNVISCR
jgi:hypothetical protein